MSERLSLLHKFLRKICSLLCINSLHPSTIKIHLVLQQFLEVTDRMENITFLESKPTFLTGKYMVQMFVHSIMQMTVMDKVQTGFIDTFYDNSQLDDNKIWNEKEGRKLLNSMKDFIDNLQTVLFEAIVEDCCEIFRRYSSDPIFPPMKGLKSDNNDCNDMNSHVGHESIDCHINRDAKSLDLIADIKSDLISTDINQECNDTCTDKGESKIEKEMLSSQLDAYPPSNSLPITCSAPIDMDNNDIIVADANMNTNECNNNLLSDQGNKNDGAPSAMNIMVGKDFSTEGVINQCKEKRYKEMQLQRYEDEMRSHIRSAIRRQVEVEIFVPCSTRLRAVLDRSFSADETALRRNVAKIAHKPQSFFGIPMQQTSPSNWEDVVLRMRDIRSKTLPHDRLEALLVTAKEIPLLYVKEHQISAQNMNNSVTLGADDFLPIFIYVLARAQLPDLFSLNEELQALCDPDKRMSETGYYLATLEASLQHVIEANVTIESQVLFPEMLRSKIDSESDCDSEISSEEYTEDEREEEQEETEIKK